MSMLIIFSWYYFKFEAIKGCSPELISIFEVASDCLKALAYTLERKLYRLFGPQNYIFYLNATRTLRKAFLETREFLDEKISHVVLSIE